MNISEKIQGDKVSTVKYVLHQAITERHQWLWLWTCASKLEHHGKKHPKFILHHVLESEVSSVGRCIWNLSKHVVNTLYLDPAHLT